MMPSRVPPSARRVLAEFVESVGADAVVLIWTKTRRGYTTTHEATFGNEYACKGALETVLDDWTSPLEIEEEEEDHGDSGSQGE